MSRQRSPHTSTPRAPGAAGSVLCSLDTLPLTLRLDDVLPIVRRGRSTVLREINAGRFQPPPIGRRPYRWTRKQFEDYFATASPRAPRPRRSRVS